MTVKDVLVQNLSAVLEETANLMVDRIVLENLAKNGKVSLEEAEFYNALVNRVITEAAEEFIPESLDIKPIQESAEGQMILTGEDGTVYSFNQATCELTPIEGTGGAEDNPSVDDMGEGASIAEESTAAEGKLVEESTSVEAEPTESQLIVSNLIKSLGA
jgi:hypothetical protein